MKKSWFLFATAVILFGGIVVFLRALLPGAHAILRGPYLQSVTPDSIWVVWDTKEPSPGRIEYGDTAALGSVVEGEQPVTHHELQITGLKPYTNYYYRLDGSRVAHFRTAALPVQSSFRFAVLGDTREGTAVHRAITNRILQAEPDFVLHTGDMVESGDCTACWDDFFAIEARLLASAPFYPTLGNHEQPFSPSGQTRYFDIFHLPGVERWYAFDYGDARFISLKADGYPLDVYYPDPEQLDWLEAQLAGSTRSWVFVFLHWGVFTSRGEDFLEIGMRERLAPLFERYGVNAVFMGRNHGYERIEVNGITYITAAGGGASLYEMAVPEPGSQAAAKEYHFILFDMDGDHLSGQVMSHRGKRIDAFELRLFR